MFRELNGVPAFDPQEAEKFGNDPLFVRAAARAVAVMSVFEFAHKPLTLNEIGELAGLDRSAAQRMVHTLQQLGMIVRDEQDRGYLPGRRVLTMACSHLRMNPVLRHATPILLELRRRTRERVDMSLWDDTRMIYALRMPSKHEIFTATLTGNTVPVYCTGGGLAVLAHLPDEEIASIFERSDRTPFTADTFTTLDEVMAEVTRTRERGHSVAVSQLLRHEIAMGAVVTDHSNRPLGAIHLAGSLDEHTPEEFQTKFAPLLRRAAHSMRDYR